MYIVYHPIDVEKIKPVFLGPRKRRPILVHLPSNRENKGTFYVERAVNHISKTLKADFEYITVTGEKHEKVLKILAEADIVLDQFILGAYGVLAIEAMALGKPVVAIISDSNKKQYPDDLPIVKANIDNLAQVIAKLIKSGELRHEIGKRSREYVAKYHSYEAYAKRMMQIYHGVMQLPEELFWNRKRLKQN